MRDTFCSFPLSLVWFKGCQRSKKKKKKRKKKKKMVIMMIIMMIKFLKTMLKDQKRTNEWPYKVVHKCF